MKKEKLSPEMQKAFDLIEQYGKIVRYRGGFWAQEGAKMRPINFLEPDFLVPEKYFHTSTVEALARRELIEISYWRNLPSGMFITEYKIKLNEPR